ncbi:MAG: histidine--tRNA ligase [Planctomycetota bacterium]|nr:MAG: histidine--tRNA ligase [Planctomycetota bacterium]
MGASWTPPRAPRGTADILPEQVHAWHRVERTAAELAERYGYRELRTPAFEALELFARGMGEGTEVVEKEMFLLAPSGRARVEAGPGEAPDAGPRAQAPAGGHGAGGAEPLALRPEFTAGVVRAYRQHGLDKTRGLLKVYSIGPLFRYERPQKGRQRQFHQVNLEALGTGDPRAELELIAFAQDLLGALGIPDFAVRLNSIGCAQCRPGYRERVRALLQPRRERLCANCRARLDRNAFRVLDCKLCAEHTADLPPMAEQLCAACAEHFAAVRAGLELLDVPYRIDARLVRGFDYYTRTVFEFPSGRLGAQDALGGGGRYDRLIPDMGGPELGACGLAFGIERLLLAMDPAATGSAAAEAAERARRAAAVYVAATPEPGPRAAALELVTELRRAGLEAEFDLAGKSLKAQLRAADKAGFGWVVIVGPEELARGEVALRQMAAGHQQRLPRAELLARLAPAVPLAARPAR